MTAIDQNKSGVRIASGRTRVGLVLGGGGAKGAYQLGVYEFLHSKGITKFHCISGTSIGALNGFLFSTATPEEATQIWRRISGFVVFSGNVLGGISLFCTLRPRPNTVVFCDQRVSSALRHKRTNSASRSGSAPRNWQCWCLDGREQLYVFHGAL